MGNIIKDRKGYAMSYVVILITLVGLPMALLSVEIVRAMYVEGHLQAAVDAACQAAVQAVDVPYFIHNGVLRINQSTASAWAQREFNATVINHNITNYSPSLSSLRYISAILVECRASAVMQWVLPGVPALILHVDTLSETRARR